MALLCKSCSDRLPRIEIIDGVRVPYRNENCPSCSAHWSRVFKRLTHFDPDASMYDIVRQLGGTVFPAINL